MLFRITLLCFLLFGTKLISQTNYISFNLTSSEELTTLLKSNNNGIDIGKQTIDLRFSKKINFKMNKNYSVNYHSRIVDKDSQLYFNEIGLTVEKNHYLFSIGKINDNNFYIPENSSGSMLFSNNYEPIPEIRFSISKKNIAKNIVYSALISHGILDKNADFYERPYLHRKYLFFDIGDIEKGNFLTIGLDHAAVWGGATTIYSYGDLGRSLSDWYNVVLAKHGESVNLNGPQGNHLGILHLSYSFVKNNTPYYMYYQKFWEDGGSLWHTHHPIWDGLWGFNVEQDDKALTVEYLKTTYQSGNYHPNGIDSYYWHIPYTFGWEYRDFTIGNFQISKDSNRVESIYVAFSNKINSNIKLNGILNILNRYKIAYQDKGWNEEIDLSNDSYVTHKMLKLRVDFLNNKKSKLDYYYEIGLEKSIDDSNIAHRLGIKYSF